MQPARSWLSLAGLLLAAEGFAVWALFSAVPAITGRAGIREAWDTPAYWKAGVPVLVVSLFIAGFFSQRRPWTLALWTLDGHFLGVLLVSRRGTDLGLLPLALAFVGAPAFALLTAVAYAGQWLKRRTQ